MCYNMPMSKLSNNTLIGQLQRIKPQMSDNTIIFIMEVATDGDAARAAQKLGMSAEDGWKLMGQKNVREGLNLIYRTRWGEVDVDEQWVLEKAVELYYLSQEKGNPSGMSKALSLVSKHKYVDAFAREKVDLVVQTDQEVINRLNKAKQRLAKGKTEDKQEEPPSFI